MFFIEKNIHELQFLGFCPTTFMLGKGLLRPGNPNMGVLEWEGKFFAFSSRIAAEKFGENPDEFVLCFILSFLIVEFM